MAGAVTFVTSYRLPTGKSYLAVVAKRAYRIRSGRRAEPTKEEVSLRRAPVKVPSVNPGAGPRLRHDCDLLVCAKPFTDVLVHATAHARRPVSELEVGLQVGPIRKVIRVTGDRRITLGADGNIGFSPPERFTRFPLTWDHAYGGRDEGGEAKTTAHSKIGERPETMTIGLFYPRNYAGRGFAVDGPRGRFEGSLVANLDDPADPLTPERLLAPDPLSWIDCPSSAGFGPIDWFTYPRAMFLLRPEMGHPKRPVYEIARGVLSAEDLVDPDTLLRFDPRVYCSAPPGQAICRLTGGERVTLNRLHAEHERLEFELPADVPTLWIEPPNVPRIDLSAQLGTVEIDPDEERVELTWSGATEVLMPYPEQMTNGMPHAALWAR